MRRQEVANPYPAVAAPANCTITSKASGIDTSQALSAAVWVPTDEGQLYLGAKSVTCTTAQVNFLGACIDEYAKAEGCCSPACAGALNKLQQDPETSTCVDDDLARLCLVRANNSAVPAQWVEPLLEYFSALSNNVRRCLTGQTFNCSAVKYNPPPPPRPPQSPRPNPPSPAPAPPYPPPAPAPPSPLPPGASAVTDPAAQPRSSPNYNVPSDFLAFSPPPPSSAPPLPSKQGVLLSAVLGLVVALMVVALAA